MAIIWELDFYSRPLLDDAGKKVWELVVCERAQTVQAELSSLFQYTQFCPSTEVNSLWLQAAIKTAIAQAPAPPDRIRFFRRQMNNMITRACNDLGLEAKPSRRTYTLNLLLQQRLQTVYPTMAGFQPGQANPIASVVSYQASPPLPLPDALRGDRWALVTLEAAAFDDMAAWTIDFRDVVPLSLLNLAPNTPVPGLLIFSSRALPLAGWLSGVELAFIKYAPGNPAQLVLETGADDRWTLATLSNTQVCQEAERFEAAKQAAQQVHFLAVQSDPNVEAFAGFWLLQEVNLS
ncbi:MAG: Tab2/Atab2 family RNA-binding protein [Cyanobacteria bacterium]|nr:Tab2/Atab2 family RNA-binding protein [Cyanobacteriota bacterium]MDW8200679.1 Tab2/Atab2 family RNA-binding protein [Cyanobacteriota bacterium SKYGB_h_bin112]